MANKNIPIQSNTLSNAQWQGLRAIADIIIPPSAEYSIPGAGDEAICKNVLIDAEKQRDQLVNALQVLDRMAVEAHGSAFADLEQEQREAIAFAFQGQQADAANLLQTLVTQCYYRDDRVLLSLGMEARAPFPQGYEVQEGDWSVLDPVRQRNAFHRPVS